MPASPAATEIMYTPRSRSGSLSSRLATSPPLRQEPLARVPVHHGGQLVDDLALLARQGTRHVDLKLVVDVAAAASPEPRRALAAQPLDRAVLCARRHPDPLGAAQGRDLDRGAADRLDDGDRHLDLEVVPLALEHGRLADAGDDVEVAGLPAASPGLALAGQPHPAAVAHARRDVHPVALDLARASAAAAGRTGVLDL